MDWTVVVRSLEYTGMGAALFVMAYLANMLLGLYQNICILKNQFNKSKFIDGALKVGAIGLGCALLAIVVVLLPEFATMVGWEIPSDFAEVFQALAVIGIFLYSTCKYVADALGKLRNILSLTVPAALINVDEDDLK